MDGAENVQQVREGVEDAARVEIPKTEHPAIRAASVVGEDRLERGVALRGCAPLLARVA